MLKYCAVALVSLSLIVLTTSIIDEIHVKEQRTHPIRQIKVITINTWALPFSSTKAARLQALCTDLRRLNPDIILFQELWEKRDYEQVVKQCGYPYKTPYGSSIYIGKYRGMAILSKHPILSTIRINYRWKKLLPNFVKAAMRSEILVAGRKIFVFNTHLTANLEVSLGNDANIFGKVMFVSDCEEATRWDQLKTLTAEMNKVHRRGYPVILGGDLNTGPRYPLWYKWQNLLKTRYRPLFDSMSYTIGMSSTYCNDFAGNDQGQLDHILAFGDAEILESRLVLTEKRYMKYGGKTRLVNVSDHYGVESTIQLL